MNITATSYRGTTYVEHQAPYNYWKDTLKTYISWDESLEYSASIKFAL